MDYFLIWNIAGDIPEGDTGDIVGLGTGGHCVVIEVIDGLDVEGDVNTGLENHLSGIIPGGSKVESEAILSLYLEVVKDQFTELVKGKVCGFCSVFVIRDVFLEVYFEDVAIC